MKPPPDKPVSMVLENLTAVQEQLARIECLKAAMLLCNIEAVTPDDFSSVLDRILPVAARLEKLTLSPLDEAVASA